MLYREAGQFKTSYAADMAIFPIRQDRIALALLLAFAFVGVPLLGHVPHLAVRLRLSAARHPDAVPDPGAGRHRREHPDRLLRADLARQRRLHGDRRLLAPTSSAPGCIIPLAWLGTEIAIPPLPVFPSILLGGLMAAIVGILFGIPSLRIKGLYLAVATLAAQFFFDWVFIRVKWFTNYAPSGSVSAPELNFFGLLVNTPIERYLLCLLFVVVFAAMAKNLVRGNLGRQWMAIRDMDIAAELMGIRPLYAKLTAFAVSSFIIGVAGALWAFVYLGAWEPLAFNIDRSLQLLFMVIIGGLGSILGSFLGAGLHPDAADLARSGAACAGHSAAHRDGHASGVHHLRLADLLSSDQGAARLCPAVGDRQGEAQALAVPLLRCGR